MPGSINWDEVFGLTTKQRESKYQQINVVSKEALSDEMKTESKPDASVTPPPAQQEKAEEPTTPESEPDTQSETDTDDSTENSDTGTGDDFGGGEGDEPSGAEEGAADDSGGAEATSDMGAMDSGSTEAPMGVNPNRSLNGKIKLSQEIRNLISEMESVLETFEEISLKTPVVVKLRELKESTELLLETVASVPVPDTMVRYELIVRNFHELVKSLKNHKK